ncbi:hypothetical protein ACOSQ3_031573 [Xanthoceras sorbifolium]
MADPSMVVSFLVSITSWFTPTTLFLFVNLVIRIIVITSSRKPHPQHDQLGPHYSPQLARPPSLIHRVNRCWDLSHTSKTKVIDNSVTEPDLKLGLDSNNQLKRSKLETKKTTSKKTETVERRRPETTMPKRTASFDDDDEGQLKLQRLDSFLRYKEMLKLQEKIEKPYFIFYAGDLRV